MPCMSGTAYPPTDCTAVLSAMGSLTAGFGMGPGDPPSMVPLMQGVRPHEIHIPFSIQGHPGGCMALSEPCSHSYQIEKMNRDEELGRLVPLA